MVRLAASGGELYSKRLKISVCATLMCVWAGVASADVTYSFNATSSFVNTFGDQLINGSFQVTVPTFISSNTTFTSDQLESFGINTKLGSPFSSVRFYVDYFGQPYDMISFGVNSVFWNYSFEQGAFNSVGNYNTVLWGTDQAGHLDVIGTLEVPEPTTRVLEPTTRVPEPTTVLLLGLGLIGVAVIRRKLKV